MCVHYLPLQVVLIWRRHVSECGSGGEVWVVCVRRVQYLKDKVSEEDTAGRGESTARETNRTGESVSPAHKHLSTALLFRRQAHAEAWDVTPGAILVLRQPLAAKQEPAQPHVPFFSTVGGNCGQWQLDRFFICINYSPFSQPVSWSLAFSHSSPSPLLPWSLTLHHTLVEVVIGASRARRHWDKWGGIVACSCLLHTSNEHRRTHTHCTCLKRIVYGAFARCTVVSLHRQDVETMVRWGEVIFSSFASEGMWRCMRLFNLF